MKKQLRKWKKEFSFFSFIYLLHHHLHLTYYHHLHAVLSKNQDPMSSNTPSNIRSSMTSPAKAASASQFRAKVAQMKNWIPNRTPTNRDRLELYAFHKQAVASDAPERSSNGKPISSSPSASSPAERAKYNAWKSKRGMSQSQAMTAYILEAERQIQLYGTAPSVTPTNTPVEGSTNGTTDRSSDSASIGTSSVLLTPRGLAAVPLLCAAASESRSSYLQRLESNVSSSPDASNGWWVRQEPLCADPGTIFALPETILLTMAILVERLSLSLLSDSSTRALDHFALRPAVVQSLLWPLHNVFLVIWIKIIFLSTLTSSSVLMLKTILLGSKRTGVTLETIFSQEIRPCKRGTASLCASHQAATVRFLGLFLYPLGMVCNFADRVRMIALPLVGLQTGLLLGCATFLILSVISWWYWYLVLPWVTIMGISTALGTGWCFAIIELANKM